MTVTKETAETVYQAARHAAKVASAAHLQLNGDRDACGFAWITITPARGPFVAYLKSKGIGRKGCHGGWQIWNPSEAATQAITAKEVGAQAFANVLKRAGVKAYADSRMD